MGLEVNILCTRIEALGATERLFSRMGTRVQLEATSMRGREAALCAVENFLT